MRCIEAAFVGKSSLKTTHNKRWQYEEEEKKEEEEEEEEWNAPQYFQAHLCIPNDSFN